MNRLHAEGNGLYNAADDTKPSATWSTRSSATGRGR